MTAPTSVPRCRGTVLVVDPDRDTRDSLQLLFELEGFEILLAPRCDEAWKLLEDGARPFALVVEWRTPGMPPRELMDRISTDADRLGRIGIIVFSTVMPSASELQGALHALR